MYLYEMDERPYVMATTVDYARGPWLDVKNTFLILVIPSIDDETSLTMYFIVYSSTSFAKFISLVGDTKNTQVLAEKILEKLIELDPENKTKFEENYEKVKSELESLEKLTHLPVYSWR